MSGIGIRAVFEQPAKRHGIDGLTGRKDDGKVPGPFSVDVGAVAHQQFHHGDAVVDERRAHERPVAALVNIGAVFEHPARHRESRSAGRFPGNPAFRDPGERSVFSIADWRAMQLGIRGHHRDDALEIIRVDCLFERADFFQRLDMRFELRPTRNP